MNAVDVSLLCKALGDANRLQIVQLLTQGEMCACKLLEYFQITQPTLSHHMKVLTECGLVTSRKEWKNTYYSLNCQTLTAFRLYRYFKVYAHWLRTGQSLPAISAGRQRIGVDHMVIKVLGSGCSKCESLLAAAKEAVQHLGIDAEVQYVWTLPRCPAMAS